MCTTYPSVYVYWLLELPLLTYDRAERVVLVLTGPSAPGLDFASIHAVAGRSSDEVAPCFPTALRLCDGAAFSALDRLERSPLDPVGSLSAVCASSSKMSASA